MITDARLAEIEAEQANNPVWQWFNRASEGYWSFAGRVAGWFPTELRRVRSSNPIIALAHLGFVLVAGFIIVTPLYLLIGPLVQIGIILIAMAWTCLAGVFGWHRPSTGQVRERTAQTDPQAQKPNSDEQSFAA